MTMMTKSRQYDDKGTLAYTYTLAYTLYTRPFLASLKDIVKFDIFHSFLFNKDDVTSYFHKTALVDDVHI